MVCRKFVICCLPGTQLNIQNKEKDYRQIAMVTIDIIIYYKASQVAITMKDQVSDVIMQPQERVEKS